MTFFINQVKTVFAPHLLPLLTRGVYASRQNQVGQGAKMMFCYVMLYGGLIFFRLKGEEHIMYKRGREFGKLLQ